MPEPTLTVERARELADELLRQLEECVGDRAAVDATLLRWLDTLGTPRLPLVCMAALQAAFADCMTLVDSSAARPGDRAFSTTERKSA